MQGSSLKTREVVRMYSVPIRDMRVRELIMWYTKMLQKVVDIIWENIAWGVQVPRAIQEKRED
ncbi:MAG: hypothetical protein QW612_03935 [Candidatus Bathyarchaeia archaeon]